MIFPFFSSGGYFGVGLNYGNFKIFPAYYFGKFGEDVPYFWSERVKFDFYAIYLSFDMGKISGKFGRFLPFDTSSLLLNSYSRGLDGVNFLYEEGKLRIFYALFSGRRWISDGEYYFNPDGRIIRAGDFVYRYLIIKGFIYKNIEFYELAVWSSTSSFPDFAVLNPIFPSYLYQWLKGRETNLIWSLNLKLGRTSLQVLIDDIQYLPSWWDTVPHKFAIRINYSSKFSLDIMWVPAFVYGNRKYWDALYESPIYGSDYAHLSTSLDLGKFYLGFGIWGKGKYNGDFREPKIGDYPRFSFLHDPVEIGSYAEMGVKAFGGTFSLGYGKKPISVSLGEIFLWFYGKLTI